MNCKTCLSLIPDLLIDPQSRSASEALAHVSACELCARELSDLQATMALLDAWEAPEVSPYFDQKLAVRLREEREAAPANWLERIRERFQLGAGRQFRPVLAGALAVAVMAAGGGIGLSTWTHHSHPPRVSPTVKDLQILDNNEQALQQEDQILQDNAADEPAPAVEPAS